MLKTVLLGIDCQNGFCKVVPPAEQQVIHDGELCVPGAWDDMGRAANLVDRSLDLFWDMNFTMDSHQKLHIANPPWFKDAKGKYPDPFTIMREENGNIIGKNAITGVDIGQFYCSIPSKTKWTLFYLRELAKGNKFPHMIWTEHCKIGTISHAIVAPLFDSLERWAEKNKSIVNFVTKGSNPNVEHFGAVKAEVVDPNDFTTDLNVEFIKTFTDADIILLFGEAKSHCLYWTIFQIANEFTNGNFGSNDEFLKKCVLLEDCTSTIQGFEDVTNKAYKDFEKRGLRIQKSTDF